MKKFLSLVLSLVMTMSLVTIGAGATEYKDFTDKGEVQYAEAVAVLNKIGIITGYEDGSFKPTGALTRGAAAKIIVSLMIGSEAASKLAATSAPYKDVPVTNTFASVISYCKTAGYINGYTDGTFRPTAALSGYAFAKMLLGAIGYRGDVEGFTGSGWTMNVAKLSKQAGLFDDLDSDFAGTGGVTREQACQLALNTLKATEVEYTANGNNIVVGDKGTITGASTNYTRSYVTSRNDNINQNISKEKSGNDSSYYTLEFGEEHFPDLKLTKDGDATDDFGRPANEWTYKSVKIGTYALTPDKTYTSAPNGDTNVDEVKDMGLKDYYINDNTTLTVNGKDFSSELESSKDGVKTTTAKNAAVFDKYASDGVLVEVYLDDDNADTISAIVVVYTQLMQVSSVQSSKVTLKVNEDDGQNTNLTEGGSVTFLPVSTSVEDGDDGYDVLKNLKADDYVLIVPVLDGSTYKVASAEVPQTVTGIITNYATKSSDSKISSVTVAGTAYKMSNMWTSEDGKLNVNTILSKTQESTVYLDTYGYAIFVSDVMDSNSAIIIDEIYSSVVDGKIVKYATGWTTNGDELTINLGTSPKYPGDAKETEMQGKVFEYETYTSNNADYELVGHADTWTAGKLVYQANSTVGDATRYVKASAYEATVGGKEHVQYASDVKFIFMSRDDEDVTGITVSEGVTEVGSADNGYDLIYVLNDDGNKIVAVVVPNDEDAGNTQNLMYIQKTTGYTSTDSKSRVALFTAYIDGEKLTNCQSNKETVKPDTFYTYSKNDTTGVYTISEYKKYTGKASSVKSDDKVYGEDLTKVNDYTFTSEATVDKNPNSVLNAKGATIVDLDTDDGYTFTTVKEMKDAITNKTIDVKTGNPITGFKVSYIFNGSDNTGAGKVAYLFITDTVSSATSTTPVAGTYSSVVDSSYTNAAALKLSNVSIASNGVITAPIVGSASIAQQIKDILTAQGYSSVDQISNDGTNYTIKATKDTIQYTLTLSVAQTTTSAYYVVSINGAKQYVQSGSTATVTGTGTGFVANSTYTPYATGIVVASADVTAVTGYVKVETGTHVYGSDSVTASTVTVPGYAPVNSTVTMTVATTANATATKAVGSATVTGTNASDISAAQTMTLDEVKAGKTLTFTFKVTTTNVSDLLVTFVDET